MNEFEATFDICFDDYKTGWDAVNELIHHSSCDPDEILGICQQKPAPHGWPVFTITTQTEAAIRKIAAIYLDCDENDDEVTDYIG